MSIYDDIDADVLAELPGIQPTISSTTLKESTTSEQSARMTAMDNASKNACKRRAGWAHSFAEAAWRPSPCQRVLAILEEEQESWGLVLGSATGPVRIEKLYSSP